VHASGVTDEGQVGTPPPPRGKLNVKNGPHQRFHELLNMKVLLHLSEIRWPWRFKYWNSAGLGKPTSIKWIVNSKLLQCNRVHCAIYHLERAYCVWCNNRFFLVIPAGTATFVCAAHFTPPWSDVCEKAHSMGRDANKGRDFAKGQKTGCAEAIKNLNLSCNFFYLSVSVCSVA